MDEATQDKMRALNYARQLLEETGATDLRCHVGHEIYNTIVLMIGVAFLEGEKSGLMIGVAFLGGDEISSLPFVK